MERRVEMTLQTPSRQIGDISLYAVPVKSCTVKHTTAGGFKKNLKIEMSVNIRMIPRRG